MNEQEAIELFVSQSIGTAREMPIAKARGFLKGLLLVTSHTGLEPLRDVYADLCSIDDQLHVLQMQLVGFEEAKD